jgi:hypothetical protein
MTFEDKVKHIDKARKEYPSFNDEFMAYLGLGHSFNGAYNYFTVEHINAYKPKAVVKPVSTKNNTVKATANIKN